MPASPAPALGDTAWQVLSTLIVVLAIALRFVMLGHGIFHHDEGVNGNFEATLLEQGKYTYDPTNYHGPTLYYLDLPIVRALGLTDTALRVCPAVFGVLLVILLLLMQRRIGRVGALTAALLWAVSPGGVYISRYFIHELLFVAFTLGILVALVYMDVLGRMASLVLAGVSAGLLFATKETAILSVGVMLAAEYTADRLLARGSSDEPERAANESVPVFVGLAALSAFCIVFCLFYSSFFTNNHGVMDAFAAYKTWFHTGTNEHAHPFDQYIVWMTQMEAPILVLGGAGIAILLTAARTRFNLFLAFWSIGMLVVYSGIAYKTPWLQLNIMLPFSLAAGAAVEHARRWFYPSRIVAVVVGLAALSMAQAIDLAFYNYDNNDDKYVYVYAHTTRGLSALVDTINRDTVAMGKGYDIPICVTSSQYWPLPWYLRKYKGAAYWGDASSLHGVQYDMVLGLQDGDEDQEPKLKPLLGNDFMLQGKYELRPGVTLLLYERVSALPHPATP